MPVNLWLRLCLLACLADAPQWSWALQTVWPEVAPATAQQTYILDGTSRDTPLVVLVRDVAGVPVYRIECHNGEFDDQS